MKNPENQTEIFFVEFLLIAFYNKDICLPNGILNLSIITPAVNAFLYHYKCEDNVHNTDHSDIINKIFITRELTVKTCTKMGLSTKTYYRYKNRYLQTFKRYLIQEIGELHI